ncbi:MAG: efflux RND transporter periplasmic adaptor subunit [Pirellulales bacterium]
MLIHSLVAGAAMALAAPPTALPTPPSAVTSPTGDILVENCSIASVQDLQIPASDAGVMTELHVVDGQPVTKGTHLATIDDREAEALYKVKKLEYEVAKQKAESDIDIRHAQKAADVARQAYEKFRTINDKFPGAVTQIELLKNQYEWEKAKLVIEKNHEDVAANALTADSKKAELDAALVALERRKLFAPFDGVVTTAVAKQGEWVQPGDPVVRLVRVDRMRVGTWLKVADWSPSDVENRKVTLQVMLPRGKEVQVNGKIAYVSPVVDTSGTFAVWAEIETPMDGKRPLILSGMRGSMTIHTTQPAIAEAPKPPAQPAPNAAAGRRPESAATEPPGAVRPAAAVRPATGTPRGEARQR